MKQFALKESTAVKVVSADFSPRKSGKKKVPSVRMVVEMTVSNTFLDQLRGPEFRRAFYGAPSGSPKKGSQDELPIEQVSDTPLLLLENLKPIKMEDELTGYTVTLNLGTGRPESQVGLTGCTLDRFEVKLLQGGPIRLRLRISSEGLNERTIGKVGTLVGCDTALFLTPPKVNEPLTGLEVPPGEEPKTTKADVAEDARHRKAGGESKVSRLGRKVSAAAKRVAAKKKR